MDIMNSDTVLKMLHFPLFADRDALREVLYDGFEHFPLFADREE